ncbi:hypothetical protein Droror1_Dr00015153 [Drosera rotundifolia]
MATRMRMVRKLGLAENKVKGKGGSRFGPRDLCWAEQMVAVWAKSWADQGIEERSDRRNSAAPVSAAVCGGGVGVREGAKKRAGAAVEPLDGGGVEAGEGAKERAAAAGLCCFLDGVVAGGGSEGESRATAGWLSGEEGRDRRWHW